MLAVGLTGGIGAGKSSVATLLAARGAAIVDADVIAREVVEPGGAAYGPVVARFGPEILLAGGGIDRSSLAARVFSDPAALADLNALTHPVIGAAMAARLEELSRAARDATGRRVAVVVIPLLRPAHVDGLGLQAVVVVDCPPELAVERLVAGRGMDEHDARARIAAQPSREERLALADFVVDNAGSESDLEAEVGELWEALEGLPIES